MEDFNNLLSYDKETGIFTWKVKRKGTSGFGKEAGTITTKGYRDVCINGKKYGLHRVAFIMMGFEIPENVDHINGCKSDNRWDNLRSASVRQNAFNYKGTGSLSGYKNVYYDPRGVKKPWFSVVTDAFGKKIRLGYFETPEAANEVASLKRKELHGEFYFKGKE